MDLSYRLYQIDYNRTSKTFALVSSFCESLGLDLLTKVYPNPIINQETFAVELDEYQVNEVYYTIQDARGSIVLRDKIELSRGFNNTKDHISETRIVKR